MDKRFLPAVAFRFRLKDPGLFRIATATGRQYLAGCFERHDWPAVPVGAVVFVRIDSYQGPLLTGRIVANTLTPNRHGEDAGLTLQLNLASEGAAPEHFAQQRITTLFLALEQLNKPTL